MPIDYLPILIGYYTVPPHHHHIHPLPYESNLSYKCINCSGDDTYRATSRAPLESRKIAKEDNFIICPI